MTGAIARSHRALRSRGGSARVCDLLRPGESAHHERRPPLHISGLHASTARQQPLDGIRLPESRRQVQRRVCPWRRSGWSHTHQLLLVRMGQWARRSCTSERRNEATPPTPRATSQSSYPKPRRRARAVAASSAGRLPRRDDHEIPDAACCCCHSHLARAKGLPPTAQHVQQRPVLCWT